MTKGDLISRQAVLDIVMDSCLDLDKWDDTDQFCKEIEDLPSVENKGEWIPVTERLPKPEDKQEVRVIVSYENEDGEFVEKGVFNKRYGFNFPSVKAWQPLPKPYKAESIDPNDMTHMFDGVTEIPKDVFNGWYTEKMLEQTRAESEDK